MNNDPAISEPSGSSLPITADPFDDLLRDLARAPEVKLADLDLEGRTLGRFEVRRRLGAGGMGVVYEAWDTRLRRAVALKALHAWQRAGEAQTARLVAEARRAAAVAHPNIAAVHDVDTVDGITLIALELVVGRSLEATLATVGASATDALRWARQIAAALGCAHRAEIVHRDLTPANIMVSASSAAGAGRVIKLLDFGIATASPSDRRIVTGTPGYMSPEQAGGGLVDARSDVFSFGVILREILASRPPRPAEVALARALRGLSDRCVAASPSRRPRDGDALVAALRAIARSDRAGEAATAGSLRKRMLAALGVAIVAAVGGALTLELRAPAVLSPRTGGHAAAIERAHVPAGGPRGDLDGGAFAPESERPTPAAIPLGGDDEDPDLALVSAAFEVPDHSPHQTIEDGIDRAPDTLEPGQVITLPVTTYLDGAGRLVTVADLRGIDPARSRGLGELLNRASNEGSRDPQAPPPSADGTIEVASERGGTVRITVRVRPPETNEVTIAGSGKSKSGTGTLDGDTGSGRGSAGFDAGVKTKGTSIDIGVSARDGTGAVVWRSYFGGLPLGRALIVRPDGLGGIEVGALLDEEGAEGHEVELASIDQGGEIRHAFPGVTAFTE